mmetsp:Transcript_16706/g.33770  ORF Transcript_16706/g.33770 Transcript_16706/m.33770 type:complete len:231 (-) Transcript_16706:338-1030(-)
MRKRRPRCHRLHGHGRHGRGLLGCGTDLVAANQGGQADRLGAALRRGSVRLRALLPRQFAMRARGPAASRATTAAGAGRRLRRRHRRRRLGACGHVGFAGRRPAAAQSRHRQRLGQRVPRHRRGRRRLLCRAPPRSRRRGGRRRRGDDTGGGAWWPAGRLPPRDRAHSAGGRPPRGASRTEAGGLPQAAPARCDCRRLHLHHQCARAALSHRCLGHELRHLLRHAHWFVA